MPGSFATAALLVLVLVVSLFAAGPLRPGRGPAEPAGLPAVIEAPATPSPGAATEETLVEAMIPAELFPEGEHITSEAAHLTMPPGSSGAWKGSERVDWPGLRVQHVLSGAITIRSEADAQVLRAGGGSAMEDVPGGTEIVLEPGDTWLARNETPYEVDNPAEAPAVFLLWVLANLGDPDVGYIYLEPGPWSIDFSDPLPPGVRPPASPATLRIRRIELPEKGRVPAAPGAIVQHGVRPPVDAAGKTILDPSLGTLRTGVVVNIGRKPITAYVLSLEPAGGATASPAATAEP